jgi:IS30 family transposase
MDTAHVTVCSRQVERKSRYLIAAKISDRRASPVAQCHIEQFGALPVSWRQTLTLDNGTEFSAFKQVEATHRLERVLRRSVLRLATRLQ